MFNRTDHNYRRSSPAGAVAAEAKLLKTLAPARPSQARELVVHIPMPASDAASAVFCTASSSSVPVPDGSSN
jgi:hypothetical protein